MVLRISNPNATVITVGVASVAMYVMMLRKRLISTSIRALTRTTPPVLKKRPHYVGFGDIPGSNRGDNAMKIPLYLYDPYSYVRDDKRQDPVVLAHLEEENKYTRFRTQHLEQTRARLYDELLSHIQETDSGVPYPHGDFNYYSRTEKGKSYQIRCRQPRGQNQEEQILLDENEMSKAFDHFQMSACTPSPDHTLLAYAVDTKGYETYTGRIKDLTTGQLLPDVLENISGSLMWGKDNQVLYYSTMDQAHRVNKIWQHQLGSPSSNDVCLHTEHDEVFSAFFGKTLSGRYLLLGSGSSETSEYHVMDLHDPKSTVELMHPRSFGIQYSVDHHDEHFYIVTNRDDAINFKLMRTRVDEKSGKHWKDFIPYEREKKTDFIECFRHHLVIFGRQDGMSQIWIVPMNDGSSMPRPVKVEFDEPLYTIGASVNKEYDTDRVRVCFSSLITPSTTYDLDLKSHAKTLLKQRPCPNYQPHLYRTEQMHATSKDGTVIPMSIVYRQDKVPSSGTRPVHLYGYGSYEICIEPDFRATLLPLLDHGVTYVIAHIRGGGEKGRSWYEDAKYKTKQNTFDDFVACADSLVTSGFTRPDLMTCEGRSAGGLLIGAILNMRPDLFQAAIAGVPFVDVMGSMCDSSIPLTTGEWEEWGNPNSLDYFHTMLSYSPYENVRAQDYPNLLITSGLYDPRVAYWEPTKWAAKLRDVKTDSNEVLLKMDMSSGHFSASDRYHYLREKAFDLAYILDQLKLV